MKKTCKEKLQIANCILLTLAVAHKNVSIIYRNKSKGIMCDIHIFIGALRAYAVNLNVNIAVTHKYRNVKNSITVL